MRWQTLKTGWMEVNGLNQISLYLVLILFAFLTSVGMPAANRIPVLGNVGIPSHGWGNVVFYLGPNSELSGYEATATSAAYGQYLAYVSRPGTYTAAIEDGYGFGPALKPGVLITPEGLNRLNVRLNLFYDFLDGQFAPDAAREFGQTFKAPGTAITGITFKDWQGILISLHEGGPLGRQVGKTVAPASFYPADTLPTIPGKNYYLKFVRADGTPFKMRFASGYPDGCAFADGKPIADADLALRVQFNPSGQILRLRPKYSDVYQSAQKSYGQTFTAKGTSLAMLVVFPAKGEKDNSKVAIRFFENGPGGRPVGPTIASRAVIFNPGDFPLVPGQKYYFEVSKVYSGDTLKLYAENSDTLEGGEMYLDGNPIPNWDLAIILIEYDRDTVAPPTPTIVQTCPAHGKLKFVWDVPMSNDISKIIIRRIPLPQSDERAEGPKVAEISAPTQGQFCWLDTGLQNGTTYRYSFHAVDAAGNESPAAQCEGTPTANMPLVAEIINGDFQAPDDFLMPYGWMFTILSGNLPDFCIDNEGNHPTGDRTAGWEANGRSNGVFYQRVACEPGRLYRISAETWRTDTWRNNNFNVGTVIGVDSHGGVDALAPSVIWSQPFYLPEIWTTQSVTVRAQADCITVFLRGIVQYDRERGLHVRFDNVKIEDITVSDN